MANLGRVPALLLAITGVLLPGAAAASEPASPAEAAEPILASEVIAGLRALGAGSPAGGPRSAAEALDLVLNHRGYPGTCATPMILTLHQARPALPASAKALLDRLAPSDSLHERTLEADPDPFPGSFRIRYTLFEDRPGALRPEDEDLDGVPDEARRILALLQEARAAVLGVLELCDQPVAPRDRPEPIYDVEVTDLPGSIEGWVWPGPGRITLLLDRDRILMPEGSLALRHQIAHLYQITLTKDESPWWYEAHAEWVADPSGSASARRARAVTAYLEAGRYGFEPDSVAAWEGAFLWPHYLVGSGAPSRILGAAWEEMARVPGNNTLAALDATIDRLKGSSIESEVRSFRIWNLFLGDHDDGRHYTFGREIATPPFAVWREDLTLGSGAGLPALAGEVVRLIPSPAQGGWAMRFTGDEGVSWDVALVTLPAREGAEARLAEIPIDEAGRGETAVPWRDLDSVFVVIQNLGGTGAEGARYAFTSRYDPLVPFDLLHFAAEAEDGVVALRWITEREADLAGWTIYRSRNPITGFAPINELLIPAAGGTPSSSYLYLDMEVRPGRKYYYVLEGVTRLGFTEASHTAAARVPSPSR